MKKTDWKEILGWSDEQLEDIRNTGYAYIRQGKYDTALALFGALVVLNPNSAYDSQTLGALHLQEGNADLAIKYLDQALKIDGDHSPTLLNMVKAQFMLGKIKEATKLAKMLAKDDNPAIANVAKALILAYT